jgi:hypothetical protein
MPLFDSLNELVIRGHQMRMHAVQEGLYNISLENEEMRNVVVDWILDLQNIDHALSYFINYERMLNMMVNEAKLDNAKMRLQIEEFKQINKEITDKLEKCMESWESQTSK